MADEFDIEALLDAPFKKESVKSHKDVDDDDGKDRGKDRRRKDRSRSRDKRSRSRKERSRSRGRRSASRRSRSRGRRSNSKDRSVSKGRRSTSKGRRSNSKGRRSHSKDRNVKSKRRSGSKGRDRRSSRGRRSNSKGRSVSKGRRSTSKSRRSRSKGRDRSRSRDRREPRKYGGDYNNKIRFSRSRQRSISPNNLAPHLINNDVAMRKYASHRSPPFPRPPSDDLTPEERDMRTVFCMQLSQRIRGRDLEEFFSSVGKVRDVKLITCNKTRRFKGIAYVEFKDPEAVPLAMGLTGQKLLGIPIIVQPTQAEKNRQGSSSMPLMMPTDTRGPMRLYVGSLHFNITEEMLRGIFEPFGKIESIQLIMDPETNRSKGYGFIMFKNSEDAKKALEQLNGFELAGRPMKVGNVQERTDAMPGASILDTDELDRSGIDLGATGRLQLMYKLAEGTGLQLPQAAANALNLANALPQAVQPTPPIATQCFMLANMFDPNTEQSTAWDIEIRDDVIEECNKHGGVLHVYVDRSSATGNVYVKCPTIATAVASVNSLHGRWFAGRVITAAYVPLLNYHALFPDALTAMQLLLPSLPRKT